MPQPALQATLAVFGCALYITTSIYLFNSGLNRRIHESSIVILVVIILGGLAKFATGSALSFDPEFVFYAILPPIIFAAGFGLKRNKIVSYLPGILIYGIFGTFIMFIVIAMAAFNLGAVCGIHFTWNESLLLSSILSATDDVASLSLIPPSTYPKLGSLLFGEGLFNDSLSIALFHTLQAQFRGGQASSSDSTSILYSIQQVAKQLGASTLIGAFVGLSLARILKVNPVLSEFPIHQTSLVFLSGYMSYSIAELFRCSGILSLFITAITLSHFAFASLGRASRISTRVALVSFSDIAEGLSCTYLGISVWLYFTASSQSEVASIGGVAAESMASLPTSSSIKGNPYALAIFSLLMLIVLVLGRFVTALALNELSKCFKCLRSTTLTPAELTTFTLGGCARGSICFAQALQVMSWDIPLGSVTALVSTSVLICTVTSVSFGMLLPYSLTLSERERISSSAASAASASALTPVRLNYSPIRATETNDHASESEFEATNESQYIYRWFVYLDYRYLKPYFGGLSQTRSSDRDDGDNTDQKSREMFEEYADAEYGFSAGRPISDSSRASNWHRLRSSGRTWAGYQLGYMSVAESQLQDSSTSQHGAPIPGHGSGAGSVGRENDGDGMETDSLATSELVLAPKHPARSRAAAPPPIATQDNETTISPLVSPMTMVSYQTNRSNGNGSAGARSSSAALSTTPKALSTNSRVSPSSSDFTGSGSGSEASPMHPPYQRTAGLRLNQAAGMGKIREYTPTPTRASRGLEPEREREQVQADLENVTPEDGLDGSRTSATGRSFRYDIADLEGTRQEQQQQEHEQEQQPYDIDDPLSQQAVRVTDFRHDLSDVLVDAVHIHTLQHASPRSRNDGGT